MIGVHAIIMRDSSWMHKFITRCRWWQSSTNNSCAVPLYPLPKFCSCIAISPRWQNFHDKWFAFDWSPQNWDLSGCFLLPKTRWCMWSDLHSRFQIFWIRFFSTPPRFSQSWLHSPRVYTRKFQSFCGHSARRLLDESCKPDEDSEFGHLKFFCSTPNSGCRHASRVWYWILHTAMTRRMDKSLMSPPKRTKTSAKCM